MEYQEITNLLGTTLDEIPRFITKNWAKVYDQSGSADDRYKPKKQIRFKISVLRLGLCDYFDAYIVVKGDDIVLTKAIGSRFSAKTNRFLAFKKNALFTNCISKINNILIDNAEDLDVVMLMYICLSTVKITEKRTGSLWNYEEMNLIILLLILMTLLLLITMETSWQILSLLNTKEQYYRKNIKYKSRKRWIHWARK